MNDRAMYRLQLCRMIVILVTLSTTSDAALAQADTIKLSIRNAENTFLQNNFSVLAARYNIDVNKALVQQAKLWDNPVISTDQNIYDAQGGFFKHNGNSGQVYIQAMQLVRTAGKRNKLARLAEDNATLSANQFDDLLRTLRFSLISDLFEVDHKLKIKKVYAAEIAELQKLVKGMDAQLLLGNISVKENLRVKALLFNLQNELINIQAQLMPLQSEINLLLNSSDTAFVMPVLNYSLPDIIKTPLPPRDSLLHDAFNNRPDGKIARIQLAYQNDNLAYQKSLAKPDITVGTEFDQRSSYAPNYVGLAVSFPIPILNKNQGNISSARYAIKQQQASLDAQLSKIESDVTAALGKAKYYQQVNDLQQLDFSQQYDSLFQNMLNSYRQKQVGLLEFIDFADAYKETKLKILDQHMALVRSMIELNYQTGKDVIVLEK